MKRFGVCEFSSFSSGSKVRARREMPTSGPGGISAAKGLFGRSPFPAEKVVVFAPARFWRCYRWKGEKPWFGCVSCLSFPGPSFVHRPQSPLPSKINLLPVFLAFEPRWSLAVKFILRGGFWDVWPVSVASIVYLSSFRHWRGAQPSPMQECGQRPKSCCRSSPLYPTGIRKSICLQNNKTESLQNSTSVKQQNSVSTQQRNSKTVTSVSTSVSQHFSQSVLQSVRLQSVSTEFSQYWIQSVLTSISQSAFLKKTPCRPSFFDWFCSRCWLRERVVRLFRLAGEQAGTGRDIRPVFESPEHYMFRGSASCVFRYAK